MKHKVEDPILSPQQMCAEADISMSTWRRHFRHRLPIIQISPRRVGARRSEWLRVLEENTMHGRAA